MEAVVTVVADVNGAFTTVGAVATLEVSGMETAVMDDDNTDADAGNNDGAVGDDGSNAGDSKGTLDKTVFPNGCAPGDDNDDVTAPGEDALFPW